MPYLTFKTQSPASKSPSSSYAVVESEHERKLSPLKGPDLFITDQKASSLAEEVVEEIHIIKHPVLKLDVDKITDATAGRLAASLLGHVLFLKNQVPFPVMQLGRIPGGKANTRAAKQRAELLVSFDTISSHLDTTFSALSTALARCSSNSDSKVSQAHLAILIGPSLGSVKSKVILGIDGLESNVWGSRNDAQAIQQQQDEDTDEEVENEEDNSEEEEVKGCSGDEELPDDSDEEDHEGDQPEDEEDEEDEADSDISSPSPPPPYISHAEEQKFLRHADRLLSRTLASADANGIGITSEMSPTQTHILIRAPRRFRHPAWIPRQNVTLSLESALRDFMNMSGLGTSNIEPEGNVKRNKGNKVEGVWITTRTGLHRVLDVVNPATPLGGLERTEDDDMIWWSWDGKFVGFADW